MVPGPEVVLRCAITGRFSSDQPSTVVKLELMRGVAENSRMQYVDPSLSLNPIPQRFLGAASLSVQCPNYCPVS